MVLRLREELQSPLYSDHPPPNITPPGRRQWTLEGGPKQYIIPYAFNHRLTGWGCPGSGRQLLPVDWEAGLFLHHNSSQGR